MCSFLSRLCHSPLPCLAAVLLMALGCSGLAFCDEIHDAAKDGNLEKIKVLLKDKPDLVSSKDDKGATPLHLAALNGRAEAAALLLAGGADVNAGDKEGTTPLHFAAGNGHKDVVELLLANKADVGARGKNGLMPLHVAAIGDHAEVAALLLFNGAG